MGILKIWLLEKVFGHKLSMFSKNYFSVPQSTYFVIVPPLWHVRRFKLWGFLVPLTCFPLNFVSQTVESNLSPIYYQKIWIDNSKHVISKTKEKFIYPLFLLFISLLLTIFFISNKIRYSYFKWRNCWGNRSLLISTILALFKKLYCYYIWEGRVFLPPPVGFPLITQEW